MNQNLLEMFEMILKIETIFKNLCVCTKVAEIRPKRNEYGHASPERGKVDIPPQNNWHCCPLATPPVPHKKEAKAHR